MPILVKTGAVPGRIGVHIADALAKEPISARYKFSAMPTITLSEYGWDALIDSIKARVSDLGDETLFSGIEYMGHPVRMDPELQGLDVQIWERIV